MESWFIDIIDVNENHLAGVTIEHFGTDVAMAPKFDWLTFSAELTKLQTSRSFSHR